METGQNIKETDWAQIASTAGGALASYILVYIFQAISTGEIKWKQLSGATKKDVDSLIKMVRKKAPEAEISNVVNKLEQNPEVHEFVVHAKRKAFQSHPMKTNPVKTNAVRESIKSKIRAIVLREMTQANFGIGKVPTQSDLTKDVKKAVGKGGEAVENPLNGKVSVDDGQGGKSFQAEITECGNDLYDVNVISRGARKTGRQLSPEKLAEFLKDAVKDDKSSVEKAFEKGKAPIKNKQEDVEEISSKVDDENDMEETKEKTQIEKADKETKKADEKSNKDVAPIGDDNSPQLGGELVDKIEKIIDRVLKNKAKAEPKTAFLKADSKMESPDKRVVKVKDTPALKGAKK